MKRTAESCANPSSAPHSAQRQECRPPIAFVVRWMVGENMRPPSIAQTCQLFPTPLVLPTGSFEKCIRGLFCQGFGKACQMTRLVIGHCPDTVRTLQHIPTTIYIPTRRARHAVHRNAFHAS